MSLERLMSRAHPTSLDRSVDREWNVQNAYELIKEACFILTLLENDKKKRYTYLYTFLDKKETYLALLKEMDVLVDKYNLRNWIKDREMNYVDLSDEIDPNDEYYKQDLNQVLCQYENILNHADKLVARDRTWKHITYDYSDDESFDESESLEQFLSYRPPSYRKILHPLSVDLAWNIRDAHDLMDHVCHIILAVEKNPRYTKLYDFLEKKEIYLALYKELDELMDKYNLKKSVGQYEFLENSEPYGDQTLLHFHDHLVAADFLVARDNQWRFVLLREEY
jgi:hypothetical protein